MWEKLIISRGSVFDDLHFRAKLTQEYFKKIQSNTDVRNLNRCYCAMESKSQEILSRGYVIWSGFNVNLLQGRIKDFREGN